MKDFVGDIVRRVPLTLGNDNLIFRVGEEESICTNCTLPVKKCNGDCNRFKKEVKKLRAKQQQEAKRK